MAVSEIIEQLNKLNGGPVQFLQNLLAAQCFLSQAEEGAFLRLNPERKIDILALFPQASNNSPVPEWLTSAIELAKDFNPSDNITIKTSEYSNSLHDKNIQPKIVLVPIIIPDIGKTAGAFLISGNDETAIEQSLQKLQLSTGILNFSNNRLIQQNWKDNCLRLQKAMETLSAVNQQEKFTSAAMSLCNETASQWQCERVSLGFLKGRYVKLKAMSHTEDFSRKMKVVQDIESAMEECLDQDTEILSPAPKDFVYINRATDLLSKRHGPQAILSLPLRRNGKVTAVLTLERPIENPFTINEVETIRLACELCTARVVNLYEHDRWFGASIAAKSRKLVALLVGSKYTWAKLLTLLFCAGILFLILGKGQYRAKAPFVLEATYQQIIPAPFNGYIEDVNVEIGNPVTAGETVLASLETTDLELNRLEAQTKKNSFLKQAKAYRDDNKTAEAQIAEEEARKVDAQIQYLDYQISQAKLVSPMSGTVVKGDLKRQIGAPVKVGDVLFEVCPLESLRAQIYIPEDQIFDIKVGQEGELALASYPGRRIKFVVEKINPIAEVEDQRNIFKVRVQLAETYPGMRPGMEGVAKVSIGRRSYAWIWSRKIVNWVKMKLWL